MTPGDWLQITGILVGLLLAYLGTLWAVIRWLLDRYLKQFDERWCELQASAKRGMDEYVRMDKEIMTLRAELPQQYVRREDWIRFGSVLDAKLEKLSSSIQVLSINVETLRDRQ